MHAEHEKRDIRYISHNTSQKTSGQDQLSTSIPIRTSYTTPHPLQRQIVTQLQRTQGNAAASQYVQKLQRTCTCGGECSKCKNKHHTEHTHAESIQRLEEVGGENSEGKEGGEAGVAGGVACAVMPDSWVLSAIRTFFEIKYSRASKHLEYYLKGAGGEYPESVTTLFSSNPTIAKHVGKLIRDEGNQKGTIIGTGPEGDGSPAPIRQSDYDDEDWRLSLGNIDQLSYEILEEPDASGMADVLIEIRDPYEWHPAEERDTQCIHRIMEEQKSKGKAKDFVATGSGTVRLKVKNNEPSP